MAGFDVGPGLTGRQVRRLANVDLDGLAITLNEPIDSVWAPRRVWISRTVQNGGNEVKSIIAVVSLALAVTLNISVGVAGPDKDRIPPGQMKKGNVPPGLAKKGGLPPGLAKKYRVGESIPRDEYVLVEDHYRVRLPYGSPQGREWVRLGRDLYLVTTATGVIADVVENWLDP